MCITTYTHSFLGCHGKPRLPVFPKIKNKTESWTYMAVFLGQTSALHSLLRFRRVHVVCFPASVLPGENPNPQQREKPAVQNTNRISSTGKWSYFRGGGGGLLYILYSYFSCRKSTLEKKKNQSFFPGGYLWEGSYSLTVKTDCLDVTITVYPTATTQH